MLGNIFSASKLIRLGIIDNLDKISKDGNVSSKEGEEYEYNRLNSKLFRLVKGKTEEIHCSQIHKGLREAWWKSFKLKSIHLA